MPKSNWKVEGRTVFVDGETDGDRDGGECLISHESRVFVVVEGAPTLGFDLARRSVWLCPLIKMSYDVVVVWKAMNIVAFVME